MKNLKENLKKKISKPTEKRKDESNQIKKNNITKSKQEKVKVEKVNNNKQKKKFKFNKKTVKTIFKIALITIACLIIAGIIAVIIFLYSVVKNAPEFNPNNLYQQEATILYDSEGKIIAKIGEQKREKITFEDMPEVLVDAIIATEDSRFFQHNGFDLPRFLVATAGQLMGKDAGGASTLTMQISKNNFSSTESHGIEGIKRKFTDIYMSIFKIEKNYTKKEIFEFYANYNLLGGGTVINGGAYGVEQACLTYFGKRAKDINLAEAAMIAGLFQSPNGYDPYQNPEEAEERRKTVLYLMERHGYITSEERRIAEKLTIDKLILKEHESTGGEYQQFIDMVSMDIINDYGLDPATTAMEIYTTMDRTKQNHINSVMTGTQSPVTGLTYEWQNDVVQAGISVIDVKTGAIVAIGGRRPKEDDGLRSLNFATSIERQIGSTAKPLYDYGPGIEFQNWSTYTPFADEPHAYSDGIKIGNWNHKFNGFLTLRESVVGSWNIPALKAFQRQDKSKIKQFVLSLGLSPEIAEDGSLHEAHALGGYNGESPLTLSAAYAAFANGGYYIKPYSYTKIVLRDTGEVLENKVQKTKVMSAETAYMITDVLVSTGKSALGRYSYINGATFGAKTGTSNYPDEVFQKYHYPSNAVNDIWVAGISPEYSIAVWYGYEENYEDYYNVISSGQNSRIFQAAAQGVFTNKNARFTKPSGVISVKVEKESYPAMLPSEFTPENMIVTELFKKDTEPTEVSQRYSKLNNVTDVSYEIKDDKINISWTPIATPQAIDLDYLNNYFKIFEDQEYREKYLNQRLEYNKNNIGELVYKIYSKDNEGNLTLLATTKDAKYEGTLGNDKTYVIKSSYTIFTDNMSDGSEITIKDEDFIKINIMLNGETTTSLNVGEKYIEQSVKVTENDIDVTKDAKIDISIMRKSDNKEVSNIDTSKEEVFTINYKVSYKNKEQTFVRTVAIFEIPSTDDEENNEGEN